MASGAALALYPQPHELPPRPPPAHSINFSHHFAVNVGGTDSNDQYVYRHVNGLCVVGLAPSHALLQPGAVAVTVVDYNVGRRNRAEMKASGKKKKDALFLEADCVLCKITTENSFFSIRCCVRGRLLEVNERLMNNPSLLVEKAATEGFIAILMPRAEDWNRAQGSLLSPEQYRQARSADQNIEAPPHSKDS